MPDYLKTPLFAQLPPTFVTQNFTLLFLFFFALTLGIRLWLKLRHIRFVAANKEEASMSLFIGDAGGINRNFGVADLMLINDHINLLGMAGANPLIMIHDHAELASLLGTVASAFGIAQTQSISEFFMSGSMAKVLTLSLIVLILMLRPQGLFASKVRR